MVTKEDYGLWKIHPVTEAFMKEVSKLVEQGIEELGAGIHTEDIGKTYLILGKLNAYQCILNLDFLEE